MACLTKLQAAAYQYRETERIKTSPSAQTRTYNEFPHDAHLRPYENTVLLPQSMGHLIKLTNKDIKLK